MTEDEAETLWRELRRVEREAASKSDILQLHRAIASLEESVREAIEVQRDSVVHMPPMAPSIGPLSKGRRAKVWEVVIAAVALVLTGAGAVLVERCKLP